VGAGDPGVQRPLVAGGVLWLVDEPGWADTVVVVDRADRIPLAVSAGRRSLRIARQSVIVGLGLWVGAMGTAALGYPPPVSGALFQEVINVA
jgi:cation transport ATPase